MQEGSRASCGDSCVKRPQEHFSKAVRVKKNRTCSGKEAGVGREKALKKLQIMGGGKVKPAPREVASKEYRKHETENRRIKETAVEERGGM